MSQKKQNVRNVNRWKGYYLEDTQCELCLYYQGKKRGCSLKTCCCENEKIDAINHNRIKRKRGSMKWDD